MGRTIKPYNFGLKGVSIDENVIPIAPYVDNPQSIVDKPFINEKTGLLESGNEYFKRMDITIENYCNHHEKKFEGKKGLLKRREIFITDIKAIGKEIDTEKMYEENEIEKDGNIPVFEEISLDFLEKELKKAEELKTLRNADIEKIKKEISIRKENGDIDKEWLKSTIKKVRSVGRRTTRKAIILNEIQKEKVLNLTIKEGQELGLPKRTLMNVKRDIQNNKALNENIRSTQIIIQYLNKVGG